MRVPGASLDALLFVPPMPALFGPTPSVCGEFVLPVCVVPLVPLVPLVPVMLPDAPAVFAFAGLLVLVVVVPQAQEASAAAKRMETATIRRIWNPSW